MAKFCTVLINPPIARAGIYRVFHNTSEKSYIGKAKVLDRRKRSHERGTSKAPKLRNAIKKYGVEAFTFAPIFIVFDPIDLSWAETILIKEYDSVDNGYNVYYDNNGPMPEDFNERVKNANTPEVRAKRAKSIKLAHQRPEVQERVRNANKENLSRPKVRAKLSKSCSAFYSNPEAIEASRQYAIDWWSNPENKGKRQFSPESRAKSNAALTSKESREKSLIYFQSDEYRQITKARLHTPEINAKRTASLNAPGVQERKAAKQRETFAKPEVKEKASRAHRAYYANPANREAQSIRIKAWWAERKAKQQRSEPPESTD